MKLLVTGFEAFGDDTINPSLEIVKRLPSLIMNHEIITEIIPVSFSKSLSIIEKRIIEEDPDVILSLGLATGRDHISIERIGINLDEARIPDNDGNQPLGKKIYEDGQDAYFANLPINAIVASIQSVDIPSKVSNTAGTYVCNHVLYGVRYMIENKYPNKKSGFIHVPCLPEQGNLNPSISLEKQTQAIIQAIQAIILNEKLSK